MNITTDVPRAERSIITQVYVNSVRCTLTVSIQEEISRAIETTTCVSTKEMIVKIGKDRKGKKEAETEKGREKEREGRGPFTQRSCCAQRSFYTPTQST